MKSLLFILLVLSLIFESSVTTLPLVLIILLVFTLKYKLNYVFWIALVFGILFDILSFRQIGLSSVYFSIVLFLVLLYQSKFEIATNTFVLVSAFLSSLAFLILFGFQNYIFLQSIFCSLIALGLFLIVNRSKTTEKQGFKKV